MAGGSGERWGNDGAREGRKMGIGSGQGRERKMGEWRG